MMPFSFFRAGLATALAVAFASLSGAALAQEPGVTFDEGSPSDKEYVLPLADARSLGRGDVQRSAATLAASETAGAALPLFGAGITRARQGGGDSSDAPTGRTKSGGGKDAASSGRPAETFAASGSQQLVTGGLIALAGLLIAGVAALIVRLRRSS